MKTVKTSKPWLFNIMALIVMSLCLAVQGVGANPSAGPSSPLASLQTVISYQGTLTDRSGDPINGAVPMVFALYDAPSDGNRCWGPEPRNVQVTGGSFHVLLGSELPFQPDDLIGERYLAITVNDEEMTPREALTAVPVAMNLSSGATAQGVLTVSSDLVVKANLDMSGNSIRNLRGFAAPTSGNVDLLYGQNNNLYIKTGAASGGVYIGAYGEPVPLAVTGGITARSLTTTAGAEIGLQENGGGRLLFKSNPGDNRIYMEAFSADGTGSASELLLTGFLGNAAPLISLVADETNVFGTLDMNGHSVANCGALTEANLQTAEERAAGGSDRFEEGDVLCWSSGQLEKCKAVNDRLVQAVADKSGRPIVIGAEQVKVIGPVQYGDLLVASDVPGYAMVNNDPRAGAVIAQALEDFDGEMGIIKAMIRKF